MPSSIISTDISNGHDIACKQQKMNGNSSTVLDSSHIKELVNEWNRTRLEIFQLSQQQNNEYVGVIRFFYQDVQGQSNSHISMKCIRLTSDATVKDLLPVLIEKFRPDLKNLSSDFCLCLLDDNGQQRILDDREKPLLLQLMYIDKEAKFLLRNGQTSDQSLTVTNTVTNSSCKLRDKMNGRVETIRLYNDAGGYECIRVNANDNFKSILEPGRMIMAVVFRCDSICEEHVLELESNPLNLISEHNNRSEIVLFRLLTTINNQHSVIDSSSLCYLLQTDKYGQILEQNQLIRLNRGKTFLGTGTDLRLPLGYGINPVHFALLVQSTSPENAVTLYSEPNCLCSINGHVICKPFTFHNETITVGSFSFRLFFNSSIDDVTQIPLTPTLNCNLDVLPGLLEVTAESEDDLLVNVFYLHERHQLLVICPLAPTLCLYMILRHKLSPYNCGDHNGLQGSLRILGKSLGILHEMVHSIRDIKQPESYIIPAIILANCLEILNLLRRDRDLSGRVTTSERTLLAELCEISFISLTSCVGQQSDSALQEGCLLKFLDEFSKYIGQMMNPQVSNQLFSNLLYHINAHLVNSILIADCIPSITGLNRLIVQLEQWGCRNQVNVNHLAQIKQILYFAKDRGNAVLPDLLNRSQQLALLHICGDDVHDYNNSGNIGSKPLSSEIQENVLCQTPLIIPDYGYLIGIDKAAAVNLKAIIGIPNTLLNFIEPLCLAGLCRLLTNERSLGRWIEFLRPILGTTASNRYCADGMTGGISERIRLYKRHGGLGLSIVAARGPCQPHQGIYIKSVLPNGSASVDGRLSAGDQLLSVNGICLLDMSQEQAAHALTSGCGSVVDLEVLKAAARIHGLGQLMSDDGIDNNPVVDSEFSISRRLAPIISNGSRHTSFRYAICPKSNKCSTETTPNNGYDDQQSVTVDSLLTDIRDSLSDDSLATSTNEIHCQVDRLVNYNDNAASIEDGDRTSLDSTISIEKQQFKRTSFSNQEITYVPDLPHSQTTVLIQPTADSSLDVPLLTDQFDSHHNREIAHDFNEYNDHSEVSSDITAEDLADNLDELSRQWSLLDFVSNTTAEVKTIGTQEVYRDPRQKNIEQRLKNIDDIDASVNQNVQQMQGPSPNNDQMQIHKINGEHMTFKEKMKFFNSQKYNTES
ncbi:hypothetical protein GJ496_010832 [Pomphorhynchus laevis]|nr:hypothetical protein GJ496_010832 [Pomphorhynchus laevis]